MLFTSPIDCAVLARFHYWLNRDMKSVYLNSREVCVGIWSHNPHSKDLAIDKTNLKGWELPFKKKSRKKSSECIGYFHLNNLAIKRNVADLKSLPLSSWKFHSHSEVFCSSEVGVSQHCVFSLIFFFFFKELYLQQEQLWEPHSLALSLSLSVRLHLIAMNCG